MQFGIKGKASAPAVPEGRRNKAQGERSEPWDKGRQSLAPEAGRRKRPSHPEVPLVVFDSIGAQQLNELLLE